jgi:hypothetical protein
MTGIVDTGGFVEYAMPEARSRFVASGDRAMCGVWSVLFGQAECGAPRNVSLVWDLSPAVLCGDLSGAVLLFPHQVLGYLVAGTRVERDAMRSKYPCFDWSSGHFDAAEVGFYNAIVNLLVLRNATGAIVNSAPVFDHAGMWLTDDMFEKHTSRGASTLLLECALPVAASGRAFAGGSAEFELVCQDFPFAKLFKSAAYAAVFRYGMGALFTGLALQGVKLATRSLHAVRNFVLISNILCCAVLGVGLFWVGGLYSRPALSGQTRDSLLVAFYGEVLCSYALVTVNWLRAIETISTGVRRPFRAQLAAIAACYVASLTFTLCLLTGATRIYDVQVQASATYAAVCAGVACFYFVRARRLNAQLQASVSLMASQDAAVLQVKAILQDVVKAGVVLIAACLSIILMGMDEVWLATFWPWLLGCVIMPRHGCAQREATSRPRRVTTSNMH